MSNHFVSLLAVDITRWWHRLPTTERVFLIAVAAIASFSLPLSLSKVDQTTSFSPKAADYPTSSKNRTPSISTQTISCKVGTPCSAVIKAKDADITDELRMEVDFLPSGLALTNCNLASTVFADLGITCIIEGTPTTKANYSLLASVFDKEEATSKAIVNLEIR